MTRRRLLLLITILLLLTVPAFAQAEGAAITLVPSTGAQADKTDIEVRLSDGAKPAMIQFCLGYDPQKATCTDTAVGEAFSGNSAPTLNVADGRVYFVWDSLTPLTKGGTLLCIELQPHTDDATVWIDFDEEFIFADETFAAIDITTETYAVSIARADIEAMESAGTAVSEPAAAPTGHNSGLTLNENTLTLAPKASAKLKVQEKELGLVWSSSNEAVATVEDGEITAIANGTALITVASEDGAKEAACAVTVTDEPAPAASGGSAGARTTGVPVWVWIIAGAVVAAAASILIIRKKQTNDDAQQDA